MPVLTVPLYIFSCLAKAGPSKESIQKNAHLGVNNNNNNKSHIHQQQQQQQQFISVFPYIYMVLPIQVVRIKYYM